MQRAIIGITLALVFGLTVFFALDEAHVTPAEVPAVGVLEGVHIADWSAGRLRWELESGRVELGAMGGFARLGALVLSAPSEGMTVRAGGGAYDFGTGELSLGDGVEADAGGYTLHTAAVFVDPGTGGFRTEGRVDVTAPGFSATGADVSVEGGILKVRGGVRAEIMESAI
jgi:hypothetical protein